LPFAGLFAAWGILPATIYPVAALARSQNVSTGAHALERTADGRWVRIEAARLAGQPDAQIAVTLRAATSRETFDLLCRAYALSRREREVVAALLAGLDTRAVSARLCVSPHTVQDHLKSVFRKTEAHSRRELLAHFSRADASQQGAAMGLLVKLLGSADVGRAPLLGLPVQRAAFRPAPADVPSRCPLSGNRRSRP